MTTSGTKQCEHCGYLHPVADGVGPDVCERCNAQLPPPLRHLFRLQNVATQRRDKINSDEEERVRLGYEIRTAVRFAEFDGRPSYRLGRVETARASQLQATLTYGHAATLWRINLGWMRRKDKSQYGFLLDTERGYWARNELLAEDTDDPMSPRTSRVIPYVQDRRNCLLFEPSTRESKTVMASFKPSSKVLSK